MTVQELFRAGKLQESIQALSNELRDEPRDGKRRTFLFELLCFAGDYARAEKHLALLSQANPEAELGALLYRSALSAERKRRSFFETGQYNEAAAVASFRTGKLNGEAFVTIEDIDPRIGPRLEVFVAGEYVWLPFSQIGSLTMQAPRYLRDLLWSSATITAGPGLKSQEFGEVLLPIVYPFSFQHEREAVKLGRETDWILSDVDPVEIPYGQKLLILDGNRAVPILEVRSLEFDDAVPLPIPS
jgi:type VI secretion system protein ImpE